MTEEQKQALIWRCRDAVAHLKQVVEVGVRGGRYSVTEYRYQLMINEIALAALTAPPVKLPQIIQIGYTHDEITAMCNVRNDAVAAMRAAGYQVESE